MVNILGIEFTGNFISCAIVSNNRYCELFLYISGNSSNYSLSLIEILLKKMKISIFDLDLISFNIGPGSFTNTRIVLVFVKSLFFLLKKPIFKFSTLEIMSYEIFDRFKVKNIISFFNFDNNLNYLRICDDNFFFKKKEKKIFSLKMNILMFNYKNFICVGVGNIFFFNDLVCLNSNLYIYNKINYPSIYYLIKLSLFKLNIRNIVFL